MGQGPVIRVGDRTRSFDPEAEAVLLAARARLQAADRGALVQRQLMSGGTCEATAFGLQGYRATGVALPLGNYHNVGPEQTIAAEYVSARDFLTEVDLLVAAAEAVGQPTASLWGRFAEAAARYRGRLEASAERFG
jgi:endoglucanase